MAFGWRASCVGFACALGFDKGYHGLKKTMYFYLKKKTANICFETRLGFTMSVRKKIIQYE